MGYQIVTVKLRDGRVFKQVIVLQADAIVEVRGMATVPFEEDEIEEIVVTHDKWDFRREGEKRP